MLRSSISDLPEELLVNVFEYLLSAAPSEVKLRHEPSLELTSSGRHTLKSASCVSKRWRRVVLPLLFQYTCLRLDITPRSHWSECVHCKSMFSGGLDPSSEASDLLKGANLCHANMMSSMKTQFLGQEQGLAIFNKNTNTSMPAESSKSPDDGKTAAWVPRFYHALKDFLDFLQGAKLAAYICSFVVSSDRMVDRKPTPVSLQHVRRDWRYPAAAAFWQYFLSIVDPDRVVIVAPPAELACLTNAVIDTFGHWAFEDMDFHILELRQTRSRQPRLPEPKTYGNLEAVPVESTNTFAKSSLIHLRPWAHISLNEGSFLKAYGKYEYFEHGPPSLVLSIKRCLDVHYSQGHVHALPALRSFQYTAIFPFANHAYFADIVPYLEELDLQFAPDPQSGILDDKKRTGKAQLEDCWQELVSGYYLLTLAINTSQMTAEAYPKLKKFTCCDSRIPALRNDLDEVFTSLCLPAWSEPVPGEFDRIGNRPELVMEE